MWKSNYRQILTDVLAEICPQDMQTTSKKFIKSKLIVEFLSLKNLMTIGAAAAAVDENLCPKGFNLM
mgnify:FL=1